MGSNPQPKVGQSCDTQLVISHFYDCFLIDSRLVKLFFMSTLINFRKDTKCRVPGLYRGSFYRLPFIAKACSSCEKPCKVCLSEMAGITLLSEHVHQLIHSI